jgi:AcrR family transcriptional regulator
MYHVAMTDPTEAPLTSLSERKRELVRDELAEAAVRVLAFQGFEDTTVDQIVAAVGVSRRTFFRYFQSKEDVIVHLVAGAGNQLCAELRARPADEPPAVALRQALSTFVELSVHQPDKTLQVSRLMLNTPGILGRFLERLAHWQADVAVILAQRSGLDPDVDLRPVLAAGVALTAFHTALRRWADEGASRALADVVDQAFAIITPALGLPVAPGGSAPGAAALGRAR